MPGGLFREVADSGIAAEAAEPLPELPYVCHAARGRQRFADAQRAERHPARLGGVALVGECIRQDHRGEEIAAGILAVGRRGQGGMPGSLAGIAQVAEAVRDLGGQLGLVEVADEVRITAGLGSLERALGSGQGGMASAGVPGASQGACFHGPELGRQRGCCHVAQSCVRGSGQAGRPR